jgi:hypothetical protein
MSWLRLRERPLAGAAIAAALLLAGYSSAADDPPAAGAGAFAPKAIADTVPRCSVEATRPLRAATRPTLVPFKTSPFPYDGKIPTDGRRFLDYEKDGRRGHTSPRGRLHLEEEAYYDKHSLLYLPPGFDLSRPEHALIMVFFHGNYTRLQQDVETRQRVPLQLADSGLNAALVVPQFAVNIADSSAGSFWQPDIFKQYLAEAAEHLAALRGEPCTRAIFDRLGVILVAYSGGYDPAAYALDVGGADARIRGVILLDALYGETEKFDKWIDRSIGVGGPGFFFSAYSDSSRAENIALQRSLVDQGIKINTSPHPLRLSQSTIAFLFSGAGIDHKSFVTSAWVRDPLKVVLSAIEGFRAVPHTAEPARPNILHTAPGKSPPAHSPPLAASAPKIRAAAPGAPEPPLNTASPAVGAALPPPTSDVKR